jgi:polyferredoxin
MLIYQRVICHRPLILSVLAHVDELAGSSAAAGRPGESVDLEEGFLVGLPWKRLRCGKTMTNPWNNHGKSFKNHGNSMKKHEKQRFPFRKMIYKWCVFHI